MNSWRTGDAEDAMNGRQEQKGRQIVHLGMFGGPLLISVLGTMRYMRRL